jgi:hypothetical protein
MQKKQFFARFGFVAISLLLVLALLAIAIPQKVQAASSTDSTANFTAFVKNGRIYINLAAPKLTTKFRVRLKDAAKSQPKFYDLAWLIAQQKEARSVSYVLPAALKKTLHIDVCLKNQTSNKITCKKVYNPGL